MPIWRFLCFVLAVSALCAFVGLSIHQQLIYASTLNFSADFLFSCLHFQLCTLMCMCMFQYSTTIDLCIYVEFQFGFGDFYVPCFQFQLYTFMCMCMFQYSTTSIYASMLNLSADLAIFMFYACSSALYAYVHVISVFVLYHIVYHI